MSHCSELFRSLNEEIKTGKCVFGFTHLRQIQKETLEEDDDRDNESPRHR